VKSIGRGAARPGEIASAFLDVRIGYRALIRVYAVSGVKRIAERAAAGMDLLKNFGGLSPATILIAVVFSIVGYIAFRRGKREGEPRPLFLGIALMAYGYFVSNAWVSLGIGALLTLLLFFPQ
jgi:hypothetical protein